MIGASRIYTLFQPQYLQTMTATVKPHSRMRNLERLQRRKTTQLNTDGAFSTKNTGLLIIKLSQNYWKQTCMSINCRNITVNKPACR